MVVACTLDFANWVGIIAVGLTLSSFVIALIYMLGNTLRSPTIGAWARIELYQLAATIFFVAGATFMMSTACSINLNLFSYYYLVLPAGAPGGVALTYTGTDAYQDYFEAADAYLVNLQEKSYNYYSQVRNTLMKWEYAATVSEYKCLFLCLLFQNGHSVDPGVGFYSKMGAGYLALNSMIMGLLSLSSLLFMLAFAANGALPWLFPLGAVFRSLPYMRGFGGALMAISLTFYLGLPFILLLNALLAYPALTGQPDLPAGCAINGVPDIAGQSCLAGMATLAATVSFATIFLPALDFIILAALARELANLFGGEVDITRLSQLV
ncbi:MAG: hypothetical protein WC759_02800 [Candidatus Micrarchaeia archaeon]|jgi:hypothetical protein